MAKNVPTSMQWITFPSTIKTTATIEWSEGTSKSNVYYVTYCYWGTHPQFPDVAGPDEYAVVSQPAQTPAANAPKPPPPAREFMADRLERIMREKGVSLDPDGNASAVAKQAPKPRMTADKVNLKVLGKAKLFIASEFFEEDYCGGPMKDYHIKDVIKPKPKPKPKDGTSNMPIP